MRATAGNKEEIMDTRTGEISPLDELLEKLSPEEFKQFIRPVDESALSNRVRNVLKREGRVTISRNSRCPCGSGKKFKKCCMVR